MQSERMFKADENDQICGQMSKFDAHRIDQVTGKAPLHRAFSVFMWNESGDKLLIQQRSECKITFPLKWANTCCSHPLANFPGEEDGQRGATMAAIRKLEHELGIPQDLMKKYKFEYFGRVIYHANQDEEWGEHEGKIK